MAPLADVFPARVVTPQKTYEKARLFVFEDRALIYVEANGLVSLAEESPVQEFKIGQGRGIPTTVQTESGTWEALKSGSCGCGSKLKSLAWQTI